MLKYKIIPEKIAQKPTNTIFSGLQGAPKKLFMVKFNHVLNKLYKTINKKINNMVKFNKYGLYTSAPYVWKKQLSDINYLVFSLFYLFYSNLTLN